jgi:hypothetical protein
VAITENGALPDRLELGAPPVRSRAPIARTPSVAPGVPAAPAAVAPAAPAKPTAPAKPNAVSLDRKFE